MNVPKLRIRADSIMEEALRRIGQEKPEYNFGRGEPDLPCPEEIRQAAAALSLSGNHGYNSGMPELRVKIAEDLNRRNHIALKSEQVMLSHGATGALYTVLSGLLQPGDEVMYMAPVWPRVLEMIQLVQAVPVPVPLLNQPDLAAYMRTRITPRTKAILLTSPHNPTGFVMDSNTMNRIADLSREYGLTIISDETYERFVFLPFVHASALSIGERTSNVVVIGSFSKTYSMTGWRIGYAVVLGTNRQRIESIHYASTGGISLVSQQAALTALQVPVERMKLMLQEYEKRRELALAILAQHGLSVPLAYGTFFLFVRLPHPWKDSMNAFVYLLSQGVGTIPGLAFGQEGEGFIRLSLTLPTERLKDGMKRFAEALQ